MHACRLRSAQWPRCHSRRFDMPPGRRRHGSLAGPRSAFRSACTSAHAQQKNDRDRDYRSYHIVRRRLPCRKPYFDIDGNDDDLSARDQREADPNVRPEGGRRAISGPHTSTLTQRAIMTAIFSTAVAEGRTCDGSGSRNIGAGDPLRRFPKHQTTATPSARMLARIAQVCTDSAAVPVRGMQGPHVTPNRVAAAQPSGARSSCSGTPQTGTTSHGSWGLQRVPALMQGSSDALNSAERSDTKKGL